MSMLEGARESPERSKHQLEAFQLVGGTQEEHREGIESSEGSDGMLPEERMSPKEGTPPEEVMPLEEGKLPKEDAASKQQKPVLKNGPPPRTGERILPEPEKGTAQRANMSDVDKMQQEDGFLHEAVLRDTSTRHEECLTHHAGNEQKGSQPGDDSLPDEGMMHQEGTGQEESMEAGSRMLCKGSPMSCSILLIARWFFQFDFLIFFACFIRGMSRPRQLFDAFDSDR